jgi:hypothetical protein
LRKVTTDNQQYMGDWLVRMMNHPLPEETVCIGQEIDGNLVAVVGYCSFMPKACQMHIAAVSEAALPAQIAELSAVTRMYGSAFTVTVTVNGVPEHEPVGAVGVTV